MGIPTVTVIMKEIDFLPEWYKSGRRRQISYRTQYIALCCIFAVMIAWNFVTVRSVSKAAAELTQEAAKQGGAENVSREFAKIRTEVTRLQKKSETIEKIDSKIDVASVLAEMSFLIDEKIMLSKVEFIAEKFAEEQKTKPNGSSAVRVAGGNFARREAPPLGDVRFKVVISGVASDASYVADLVCKLEDSPYFCQVIPSFSRNREIKVETGVAEENLRISEFEIRCYLANYSRLKGVPQTRKNAFGGPSVCESS